MELMPYSGITPFTVQNVIQLVATKFRSNGSKHFVQ